MILSRKIYIYFHICQYYTEIHINYITNIFFLQPFSINLLKNNELITIRQICIVISSKNRLIFTDKAVFDLFMILFL